MEIGTQLFHNCWNTSGFICASLVILAVSHWLLKEIHRWRTGPPGPWGYPIVGHLPLLTKNPPLKLLQWSKTYGNFFSIRMGSRLTLVITGYEALKDAFLGQSEEFAGRPDFASFQVLNDGKTMAFGTYGKRWKLHKKIMRSSLRLFVQDPNNRIEDRILEEADLMIKEMTDAGTPVLIGPISKVGAGSIIYQICFGLGANVRQDKDFLKFLLSTEEFQRINAAGGNPSDLIPWLGIFTKRILKTYVENSLLARKIVQEKYEHCVKTHDKSEIRNVTDGLYSAALEVSDEELQAVGSSQKEIVESVVELLGAGQGTVSTITNWITLYMTCFPDIQNTVHEEIDRVIGPQKDITFSDRDLLPYTEATIMESHRFSYNLPFLLPHAITKDTRFRGYTIQKGTLVMANMYSVSQDTSVWNEPEKFEPRRFLDDQGKIDRAVAEKFPAFGLGKRRCVGERLGRMASFIIFARLMQRCKFVKVPDVEYILEGKFGFTMEAHDCPIAVRIRQ